MATSQVIVEAARRARRAPLVMAAWNLLRLVPALRHAASRVRQDDDSLRVRDIDAICRMTLPPNLAFRAASAEIERVEGMLPLFSLAIMDTILSFQDRAGVSGHMLEMGVFRGKSAALLGRYLHQNERLVLVDIADHLDRRAVAAFGPAVEFVLADTDEIRKTYSRYSELRGRCRFVHIDASHAFVATFKEMKVADEILSPDGIISVDDFGNMNYSQNAAAIFKYLFATGTDLTVLMVTNQKVYLCRRSAFPVYGGMILDRFIAEMASRELEVSLARTDVEPDYRAFYARDREPGENGFYGPDIYRNQLIRP